MVQGHIVRALLEAHPGAATTAAMMGAAVGLAARGMEGVAAALREWFHRHGDVDFNAVTLRTPDDAVVDEFRPFLHAQSRALLLRCCPVTGASLTPLLSHVSGALADLTLDGCNWLEASVLRDALPLLRVLQSLRVAKLSCWQGDLAQWVACLPPSLVRLEMHHCGRLLASDAVGALPPLLVHLSLTQCPLAPPTASLMRQLQALSHLRSLHLEALLADYAPLMNSACFFVCGMARFTHACMQLIWRR